MDRNEGIWAYSNTGTKAHAFVQTDDNGNRRAMCRATLVRSESAIFHRKTDLVGTCTRCATLADAMYDRAESSMAPATEAHDLGHVSPVAEERTAATSRRNREFADYVVKARRLETEERTAVECDCPRRFAKTPSPLGRDLHARNCAIFIDALHAEALEMDAEETAKVTPAPVEPSTPQRWRYTADLKADGSVSRIGGYVTAPTRLRALYEVRNAHKTDGTYIHDLILTPLN